MVPSLCRIYPNGSRRREPLPGRRRDGLPGAHPARRGAAARGRADRRRAGAAPLHRGTAPARGRLGDLGRGPHRVARPRRAAPGHRPLRPRRRAAGARRPAGPRGHQDQRRGRRAPGRHRAGRGLRGPGRPARRLRAPRARRARPGRGGAPPGPGRQRDARAAQAHPRARVCCRTAARRSRSSPTAGCRVPPARSRPPSTSRPRPRSAARWRRIVDGDVVTVDAERGLLTVADPDTVLRPAASAARGRLRPGRHRPRALRHVPRHRRARRRRRQRLPLRRRAPPVRPRRPPLPSTSESLLDLAPVDPGRRRRDRRRGGAAGPRPGRRRAAGHRADAAHPGGARRGARGRGRGARDRARASAPSPRPRQAEEAAAAGASFLVSPGTTPMLLEAMLGTGLPFLPGTATVSEVLAVLEAGVQRDEALPGRGVRGHGAPARALGTACPSARFCPTGGITVATRARLPGDCPTSAVSAAPGSPPATPWQSGDWARIEKLAAEAAALAAPPG